VTAEPAVRRRGPVAAAIAALRPRQWTKNGLVLAALLFSSTFTDAREAAKALVAVVAFCLLSSTGYVYNDLRDVSSDRQHPTKRHRPLAAGELSERGAWLLMAGSFGGACVLSLWLGPRFLLVAGLYFATTLAYSLHFKHIVILDVMALAGCYIWRAAAGAVAIDVRISPWLLVCTAFGALFLGFNKRRGEIVLLEGKHTGTRKALAHYSPAMLQEFQAITTSGTIISYALYTVQGSPTPRLLLTLPYVLFGIFRYIYLMDQRGEGAAPDETLLRDRPIQVTILLYVVTAAAVLLLS
jgi:4-hydroxybenzoate polyprenyltransferase